VTDGFSAEEQRANSAQVKKVEAGELSYQEKSAAHAIRSRLEMDGVSAEKSHATMQVSVMKRYAYLIIVLVVFSVSTRVRVDWYLWKKN